jgi:hypothetical protein
MSDLILENNNPAGRLWYRLSILKEIQGVGQLANVAKRLNVPENWDAMLLAATELRREFDLLEEIVEGVKDEKRKYNLWKKGLEEVRKSVSSFNFNMPANTMAFTIAPEALFYLTYISADLAQEDEVPPDELENIRKLCDDLRQEIQGSSEMPTLLKIWLLEMLRAMREGIDCYQIRGKRGLRSRLNQVVGSLVLNMEFVNEAKKDSPKVMERFWSLVEKTEKLSRLAEHGTKALEFAQKVVGIFSGPSSLPPPSAG